MVHKFDELTSANDELSASAHLNYIRPATFAFGFIAAIGGLIVVVGYLFQLEAVYRPIPNGPATNSLTAIIFCLLGFSLTGLNASNSIRNAKLFAGLLALLFATIRIVDAALATDMHLGFTPFQSLIQADYREGKANEFGLNTAVMFFLVSLSVLFSILSRYRLSQVVAFFAMFVPSCSLIGYAYGLANFYGQMSLYTTALGLVLCFGVVALTANRWIVASILSPRLGGRLARFQILIGYAVPLVAGFLIVKTFFQFGEGDWFGAFIISISWFVFILIGFSAYHQERIDVERTSHERKLRLAALHDPLTGIPNRRMFFERGASELKRAKRSGNDLWLLALDVDNFKQVNDTAGHAIGDNVLVAISKALTATVRTTDLVSRIGGEEFALLLLDTTEEGAVRVAEQIRLSIENLTIEGWTNLHGPVTVSIGGCSSSNVDQLETLLRVADDAMYRSKFNGKNQVAMA